MYRGEKMNEMTTQVQLADRTFTILGTAHVSQQSVEEVAQLIEEKKPDVVCVELDEGRFKAMQDSNHWEQLDIKKVIKEGKGFLLLANLALSSYQKRLGESAGVKPGDEMRKAIEVAEENNIPTALCDREISLTLKRAWSKSGLWTKAKLIAALLSSALSTEKIDQEQIESLKEQNELEALMSELATYLPSVKEVLIDERDRYIATKIWQSEGKQVLAVLGAGHRAGVISWLERLAKGEASEDLNEIKTLPPAGVFSKIKGWIVPALLIALFALGFIFVDVELSLKMMLRWVLLNGSLAALGTVLALGHPLSVLVSFFSAPIGTIHPFIAVGVFSSLSEIALRKPRVMDLQNISEDALSLKGFYKNRISRALLVFFLSSLGGAIGNFIAFPTILKTLFSGIFG